MDPDDFRRSAARSDSVAAVPSRGARVPARSPRGGEVGDANHGFNNSNDSDNDDSYETAVDGAGDRNGNAAAVRYAYESSSGRTDLPHPSSLSYSAPRAQQDAQLADDTHSARHAGPDESRTSSARQVLSRRRAPRRVKRSLVTLPDDSKPELADLSLDAGEVIIVSGARRAR